MGWTIVSPDAAIGAPASAPPSAHVDRPVHNWIALTVMIAKIIPDVAHGTRAY
jgi:hypothetical protein